MTLFLYKKYLKVVNAKLYFISCETLEDEYITKLKYIISKLFFYKEFYFFSFKSKLF